jgi:predicted DNA-binding antitoxin AbrB/MazE fold protein
MTKIISAIYQNGVLQPAEQLPIPDGSSVQIAVFHADLKRAWDPASAKAVAKSIAASHARKAGVAEDDVARNHDRYLYGDRSEFARGPSK